MFSVQQKRDISEAIQKILRDTKHPELPETGINFSIQVQGKEPWSYALIHNNACVSNPTINPWNEKQASKEGG